MYIIYLDSILNTIPCTIKKKQRPKLLPCAASTIQPEKYKRDVQLYTSSISERNIISLVVRFRKFNSRFADLREVGKGSLLGSNSHHLGRSHHKLLLLPGHHIRVFLSHDFKHAREKLLVRVVSI